MVDPEGRSLHALVWTTIVVMKSLCGTVIFNILGKSLDTHANLYGLLCPNTLPLCLQGIGKRVGGAMISEECG